MKENHVARNGATAENGATDEESDQPPFFNGRPTRGGEPAMDLQKPDVARGRMLKNMSRIGSV